MKGLNCSLLTGIALANVVLACGSIAHAADESAATDDLSVETKPAITSRLVTQTYIQGSQVATGNDNPGNQIAQLPAASATQEVRLDLKMATEFLSLQVSPRIRLQWNEIQQPGITTREGTEQAYINAWRVQWIPTDNLTMSVGREILLWGPGLSYSPSNPFYLDNGRSNPNVELPGKDFAKINLAIGSNWALSYIDNYGLGVSDPAVLDTFHHTRVLKLDRSSDESYASINYAWLAGAPAKIGFSAQATLSEAWLAYVDLGYNVRRTQYVPELSSASGPGLVAPTGGPLSGISVLGAAYTFQSGPTLTFEWINNNQGWSSSEYALYQTLAKNAAQQLDGPNNGAATELLARGTEPGSVLLRKNYLFLQYFYQNLAPGMDLTLRTTYGVDDNSTRIVAILEKRLEDRYSAFGQINYDLGSMEFGRYLNKQFILGIRNSY